MSQMNGSKPQARAVLERLMASERFLASSHFSERVYTSEPIIITGRQMASYLPDKYREMRSISRWEEGANGQTGRWLSEAELFYRQGRYMEDFEDDCPYHGTFKSYFPTYNAMSDRQLRGYFTWRGTVRRGVIEETSLSFAYVYMYELINGIGVSDPLDGFHKLEDFWQTYRAFSPEIDRFASVWLQDYAVYHGLSPELLEPYKTLAFDRALLALRSAEAIACPENLVLRRRKRGESALELPANAALEDKLLGAIDALSTYRVLNSRLYKQHPEALRHVTCAVFARLSEYHRKQRKSSLLESLFGEEVALAYTMFGSAVFFEAQPHADAMYELDEVHRYRCERGRWTCERFHGSRSKSPKLGDMARAVDRSLREALGFDHPLKDAGKTPKYLQKFIDEEIAIWMAWQAAHVPLRIEIDLSQLAGIRTAADVTRESLLIDEEREESLSDAEAQTHPQMGSLASNPKAEAGFSLENPQVADCTQGENNGKGTRAFPFEGSFAPADPQGSGGAEAMRANTPEETMANSAAHEAVGEMDSPAHTAMPPTSVETGPSLSAEQTDYLRSLLTDEGSSIAVSEDLLVDTINEALFDLFGDTVIEYGANGPELIEDYRGDVEGLVSHV